MYDNTSLKVLELIYLNKGIHKRELSKKAILSMTSIENALEKLAPIIKANKSGNRIQFTLNYARKDITPLLSAVENNRFGRLPSKIRIATEEFIDELEEKPLIAVLFGSYAKNTFTKESDIDIMLVYQEIRRQESIENTARKVSMKTNTTISPVYLDYKIFKESFHDSSKGFFKNLKKDKIILAGMEWWRQLENEET